MSLILVVGLVAVGISAGAFLWYKFGTKATAEIKTLETDVKNDANVVANVVSSVESAAKKV